MKRTGRRGLTRLLLAGVAVLSPAYAHAQEAQPSVAAPEPQQAANADTPPDSVGEIIVTAQGRRQRLQDVPISASVATGADIQKANLADLQAVAVTMPTVRIAPGPGADNINIRGVGSGVNGGFEQSVATFVDGAYRGRGRSIRSALFDLERLEVLKGPQTTFFGNNAIAGAFNIVTRKPGSKFEYNASALYSPTDGEFSIEGGTSVPLADNFSIRLASKFSGMDGYTRNAINGEKGPHMRDYIGRASIHWEPTSSWEMDARIDYGHNRDKEQAQYQLLGCPPPPEYGAARGLCLTELNARGGSIDDKLDYDASVIPSSYRYDFVEGDVTNRWTLGELRLTSVSTYFHHNFQTISTVIPLDTPGVGGTPYVNNVTNRDIATSYSQEFRLQSPTGQPIEWMVGAYYQHQKFFAELMSGNYYGPFGTRGAPYYNANTPTASTNQLDEISEVRSVFASATVHLAETLRLNLGARYSSVHKRDERAIISGMATPIATPDTFVPAPLDVQQQIAVAAGYELGPFDDPTRTDDKFMPSVSLQYDLIPGVMGYASYTKGFKAGGYALNSIKNPFDPETVDAYEVGLKGSAFDRRLSFALALYLSDYKNLQESTTIFRLDGSALSGISNVGKSRSQGVDFSASWRAADWLQFRTDLGYLDAKYKRFPNAPCTAFQTLTQPAPCTQDLSGGRRAFAPKFSGSVGATITAPVHGPIEARIDPSMYFTSSYYGQATADPLLSQPGYAKFDLRIGVGPHDGSWEAAIIGKNLTDKVTSSYRNSLPTSPGTIIALVERPRSVAFQFSIRH